MAVSFGYNGRGELVTIIVEDVDAWKREMLARQFHDIYNRAAAQWAEISKQVAYWISRP